MNDNLNIFIEKLNEQNSILKELYDYVSSKNFKIDIEEIDAIDTYYEKREHLLKKIEEIENLIKPLKDENILNNDTIKEIIEKNKTIIRSIINIDNQNKVKFDKIFSLLKQNIKNIKNGEKANKNYFGVYNSYSEGNYFSSEG